MRYLENVDEIDNEQARKLLNIPASNAGRISKLFNDMLTRGLIVVDKEAKHNQRVYKLKTNQK
ncbi:MAG: hypothetical protein LBO71_05325 [Prevotellaceae bacterium]|jgi:hypothetical protein|nr:hypothetical protein [Prevotellaceae bacterium]